MEKFRNIFKPGIGNTDISELLLALASPNVSIEDKREIWRMWKDDFYSLDALMDFFGDSLFSDDGETYVRAFAQSNYKDFYELAMSMDMAGLDPRAYYLYWILNTGNMVEPSVVKTAIEYDPDTIHSMLPGIEEVIFAEE